MVELCLLVRKKERAAHSVQSNTSFDQEVCYCAECRVVMAELHSFRGRQLFSKHAFSSLPKVTVSSSVSSDHVIASELIHETHQEASLQHRHVALRGSDGRAELCGKQRTRSSDAGDEDPEQQAPAEKDPHNQRLAACTGHCVALCCCPFTLFELLSLIWKLPFRKIKGKLRKKCSNLALPENQNSVDLFFTFSRFPSSHDPAIMREDLIVAAGFGDPDHWKKYFGSRRAVSMASTDD